MRVAVIGAGLIGAAVARELTLLGAETSVFEAGRPGRGASGTTFAWVNSHNKAPRAYHDLNVAGMEAHRELDRLPAPGPRWYFGYGNIEWAGGAAQAEWLASATARLGAAGYRTESVPAARVRDLEPDVVLPAGTDHAVFFPGEAYVLPALLLGRLLGEATDRGARLAWPAPVLETSVSTRGVRLRLGDGTEHEADVAICCAGRWTSELVAPLGCTVPLDSQGPRAVGYLGYTDPVPVRLRRVLMTPRLNVRPDGGGRLLLHGLDLDPAGRSGSPDGADAGAGNETLIAAELGRRLAEVLPGARDVRVTVRAGRRVLPADGASVAGWADDGRVYVIATHSGVTLAPLLGRLAALEVVRDSVQEMLRPFRPQRFS
ncbi:MAG: FAD-binding oxidoreductase [Streptosporangiaceae bacterium]|nr:FAD-binding oxidoreductase [Streptosporangiaceae bacterium]MBV9853996.1 FAD-binding oxidoreductase [Streptosporangiaceae bacterium]